MSEIIVNAILLWFFGSLILIYSTVIFLLLFKKKPKRNLPKLVLPKEKSDNFVAFRELFSKQEGGKVK